MRSAASRRSASDDQSGATSTAAFPPSSRVTCLRGTAVRMRQPTGPEPVKETTGSRPPPSAQTDASASRPVYSYAAVMARYFDVHPVNPQARSMTQVAALLQDDALIAYPTDSSYALGCRLDSRTGPDRIRGIRDLDDKHHFTLVCAEFAQLGQLVHLSNAAFRAIKAATPGPYTFILPATREVPRRLAHPKKGSVGVRIPDHPVVQALLRQHGEPLLSSTLILPGSEGPMTDGWQIKEELDAVVDAVVDAGDCGTEATTVVDWSDGYPEVTRVGAGDPDRFG